MSKVVPLSPRRHCNNPRGEVTVYIDVYSGLWVVDHTSRSGDSVARLSDWLERDEAVRAACQHVRRTGCDFPQLGRFA